MQRDQENIFFFSDFLVTELHRSSDTMLPTVLQSHTEASPLKFFDPPFPSSALLEVSTVALSPHLEVILSGNGITPSSGSHYSQAGCYSCDIFTV